MALHLADYTALVPKSQPDRKTVAEAAGEVGLGEATIWRYLQRGLLKRYYQTVGKRRTMVDMGELRDLLAHPPSEPAG